MIFKIRSLASAGILSCALFLSGLPVGGASAIENAKDKHGAVACESATCSNIGIDLLKKGGSAADALVGTVLCVGVKGMYHSG